MKKAIFTSLIALVLSISFVSCSNSDDDDNTKQSIAYSALPENARTFIELHFPEITVALVQQNAIPDLDGSIYDVYLSNGFEIDFTAEGNWTDVDGKLQAVPAAIIPTPINEYVATNYPNLFVTSIEIEAFGYDIELSNGLDLLFDPQGNFIRIDY